MSHDKRIRDELKPEELLRASCESNGSLSVETDKARYNGCHLVNEDRQIVSSGPFLLLKPNMVLRGRLLTYSTKC